MTPHVPLELDGLLQAVGSLDRAKLLVLMAESPRRSTGVHVLAEALGVGT